MRRRLPRGTLRVEPGGLWLLAYGSGADWACATGSVKGEDTTMIPGNITRDHVLHAISYIDRHGVERGRESTRYDLDRKSTRLNSSQTCALPI